MNIKHCSLQVTRILSKGFKYRSVTHVKHWLTQTEKKKHKKLLNTGKYTSCTVPVKETHLFVGLVLMSGIDNIGGLRYSVTTFSSTTNAAALRKICEIRM